MQDRARRAPNSKPPRCGRKPGLGPWRPTANDDATGPDYGAAPGRPASARPAPYSAGAVPSRGRFDAEPECPTRSPFQRDRDRIAAFDRLPPAHLQDAGVRLPRGRPLPHAADALARGGADRPHDRAPAAPRRGSGRGASRWRTISAIRRSGMPASGRSTGLMADFGGFDHNAQSLRVVTALERKYAQFDGLNLTWETLEGLAKHNGPVRDSRPSRRCARRIERLAEPRPFLVAFGRGAGRRARRRHRLCRATTSTTACARI